MFCKHVQNYPKPKRARRERSRHENSAKMIAAAFCHWHFLRVPGHWSQKKSKFSRWLRTGSRDYQIPSGARPKGWGMNNLGSLSQHCDRFVSGLVCTRQVDPYAPQTWMAPRGWLFRFLLFGFCLGTLGHVSADLRIFHFQLLPEKVK